MRKKQRLLQFWIHITKRTRWYRQRKTYQFFLVSSVFLNSVHDKIPPQVTSVEKQQDSRYF